MKFEKAQQEVLGCIQCENTLHRFAMNEARSEHNRPHCEHMLKHLMLLKSY